MRSEEDLDRAIAMVTKAEKSPMKDEDLSVVSNDLGEIYYTQHRGSRADLDQANIHYQVALSIAGDDHAHQAGVLRNRATMARFQQTGSIEQAIAIMEEGIRFTSNDNPVRAQILSNLGSHGKRDLSGQSQEMTSVAL
jgi:tetratricopeptide (TPR) repeat protein